MKLEKSWKKTGYGFELLRNNEADEYFFGK